MARLMNQSWIVIHFQKTLKTHNFVKLKMQSIITTFNIFWWVRASWLCYCWNWELSNWIYQYIENWGQIKSILKKRCFFFLTFIMIMTTRIFPLLVPFVVVLLEQWMQRNNFHLFHTVCFCFSFSYFQFVKSPIDTARTPIRNDSNWWPSIMNGTSTTEPLYLPQNEDR